MKVWSFSGNDGGLGPGGFGYLGSSYERDGYLGVPLESQTTNPNHPCTIWVVVSNIFLFSPLPGETI